jgi:hypothetical protein
MNANQPELLEHGVLRAAAWPIETVAAFAAPDLAAAAATVSNLECGIQRRRDATLAALHAVIPTMPDRATRAYLLAVKRWIHGRTAPLPPAPPQVLGRIEADPGLARLLAEEDAHRRALRESEEAFGRLHDAEMERQRRALRLVAGTSRFLKALLIANPPVAERWMAADPELATASARIRRLEATVFHYLTRAVGRPTPHGAWAGVVPVSPTAPDDDNDDGPGLTVRPAARRYSVAVDLLPFALMLRALTRQLRYRQGYPLRLNPTVHRSGDGWRYEREDGGVTNWVTLPEQSFVATVIDYYADGRAKPAGPLLDVLGQVSGGSTRLRVALERLVDSLIDRDVLRSDLALPPTASSVWTALDAVTGRLVESDRSHWCSVIDRLQTLCAKLAQEFDVLDTSTVDQLRRAIEAEVQSLWEATGLPGTAPGPVVRLDLRLPFAVSWSAKMVAAAGRTVRALLDFHAADGGAELFRLQTLEPVLRAGAASEQVPLLPLLADDGLGWAVAIAPQIGPDDPDPPDAPDTRETIFSRVSADHPLRRQAVAQCRAWEERLEPVYGARMHVLPNIPAKPVPPPGPGGAVLLRLAADGDLWVGPGRPEPAMFATRFASLLDEDRDDGETPIIAALRECAAAAARCGVTPIEIVGWNPLNPNTAIRPALNETTLDPHGAPSPSLHGLSIVVDAVTLRPWLRDSQMLGPLLPVYSSAAAIGWHDRCNRLLLTLALGHGWEFLAHGFPALRAERTRWRHLPRLVLPGGSVLTAERWTIDSETLRRLTDLRGAARFRAWRREVDRLGLPELVHVRCGPAVPELLVPTDSPLAVQCLFDTVLARAPWIQIAELPGSPDRWPIQDTAGNHYLAELAVSWHADGYWAAVAPGESTVHG